MSIVSIEKEVTGTGPTADPVVAPAEPARPGHPRRRQRRITRLWRLALLLALLGAWQLVATFELVKPVLARTPKETWDFVYALAESGELWTQTRATLSSVFVAFALASVVGIVVGLVLGVLPRVEEVTRPFIDAFNSMPRIALAPMFIVYFGITPTAKVALAFSIVVFMVLSATQAGVRSVDPELLRLSTVLGSTKVQLFRNVLLPTAVPSIFGALRLGMIYSLLGVVASEMIAAREGLGLLVAQYSGVFRLEGVYGILIVLAVISVSMNQLMVAAERWILRWRPPVDR